MEYLMSISKRDLGSMCMSLNLPKETKDEMIASVSDIMLDIVRDSTSYIIELIENDDNIKTIA